MTTHTMILPPIHTIHAALARLSEAAQKRDDLTSMRAYDRAAADLVLGRTPLISDDAWLIPSSRDGGTFYRVRQVGGVWSCNCEHGIKKGGLCRHLALSEGINQAWEDAAETGVPTEDEDDTTDIEVQYDAVPYPHGIGCVPPDQPADDFSDVGPERRPAADDTAVRSLISRLTEARARIAA